MPLCGIALISKTELLFNAKQPKENRQPSLYRNLAVAASLLLVIGAASFAGYGYYRTPVTFLDVDINPSLELGINAFSRVVEVRFFNADAEKLIDEGSLNGLRPEAAVGLIVSAADGQGYFKEDEANVVSLAAVGSGDEKTTKMLESCTVSVESGHANVTVYKTALSEELKSEADAASISAGKLNLIKMMQKLDDTATIDDYRDTPVTKILGKLDRLTSDESSDAPEEIKTEIRRRLGDLPFQPENTGDNHIPEENENSPAPSLAPPTAPSSVPFAFTAKPSGSNEQGDSVTKPIISPPQVTPNASDGQTSLPQSSVDTQHNTEPDKNTPAPSEAVSPPSPPPQGGGQKPVDNQPHAPTSKNN